MSLVRSLSRLTLAVGLLVVGTPFAHAGVSPQGDTAVAWPTAWNSYRMEDGTSVFDVLGDENPDNADLSSGPCTGAGCAGTSPTVYYASDGTNAFFRMRIAVDPADVTKGGLSGNAYLTQIAVNGTVVAVAGVDGKSASVDYVYVASAPGTTVTQVYTWPFTSPSAGMRVVPDGAGDYFIDWQVPIARLTTISGGAITATTPIQLYWGSSAAANLATLNKDLMLGDTNTVSFADVATVSFSTAALSATSSAVKSTVPALTVGQPSQYTVTWNVTNSGGGELSNATSSATLPAGVTFVSGPGVTASGSTVTWNAGTLLPGETDTVAFVVSLTPAPGTQGTNVPLLSQLSGSGTDLVTGSPRTATAPALTAGPVAAEPPTNGPPSVSPDTLTVAEDASNTVNVLANDSDPDGDPLTVTITGAPAHGSTSVAGGVVTYTPGPNYAGPDTFTYTACDPSAACASTTVSVTVTAVNDVPTGLANTSFSTPEDTAKTGSLPAATDVDGDALSYAVTSAPAHGSVTVDPSGTYTYTPEANYTGPDSFGYRACDPSDACVAATASVTVTPVNDGPGGLADTAFSTPEDTAKAGTLPAATDVDGDALTYSVTTAPTHGDVTIAPNGSYTYTPDADYNGPDSFGYQACDAADACVSASASVTVTPVNDAPGPLAGTSFATPEDTPRDGSLPAGTDVDGDALTYSSTTQPAHGTVTVNPNGTYTYTPDVGYNGPDSFGYRVCDPSDACSDAVATVTVTPVNDAPGPLAGTSLTTPEDTPRDGSLPAGSDVDGDALTYSVTTPASHGTAVVGPDGSYTYTPVADYNGPDSFGYQVCDPSGSCSTAIATVTVTPVNDTPEPLSGTNVSTPEDTPESGSLPAATDVDGDALTYSVAVPPIHGDVTIEPNGTYTYTPDPDYNGPDSFGYQVCDASDACSAATALVTVTPVNDPPGLLAGTSLSTPEDTPEAGTLPAGTDVDGDALTYSATTQPEHGDVTVGPNGTYTYTPDPDYTGPDSFGYQVCDASGACSAATATVTVTPVNDTPGPLGGLTVSTPEDTPASGALPAGADADGDALTYSATAQPEHGTVTVEPNGTYTYTPDPDYNGPDTFGYRVCDPSGACSSATAAVTVTPVNDPPAAPPNTTFSMPENDTETGTLPGSTDPEGDPVTFSLVSGPANGAATVAPDGAFAYTPDPNYVGGDGFVYQVCDPSGACAQATVAITVVDVPPGNVAPVATDDTPAASPFGEPVVVNVLTNDTDANGDPLTISSVTQGANGAVAIVGGTVTYTPENGFSGTDTFTYTVCDAALACDTATVTVNVLDAPPANMPPVANAGDDVATKPGVVHLDGSGSSDPDGDPLTYAWVQVSGPAVTLTGADTATPSFTMPVTGGAVVLQLTVSDGTDTDTDTVTVLATPVVVPPPPPPAATPSCDDESVVVNSGSSATVVLDCDDAAGSTVTVVGGPGHGAVEVLSDGTLRYVPAPGYAGTDAFTVRVCVAGRCTDATVTVAVRRGVTRPSRLPVTGGGAETLLPMAFVLILVGAAALRRGTRAGAEA